MSVQSTPFGYSIFDFLTRIIPGLVVVIPIGISFVTLGPNIDIGHQTALIGLAVIGLVIGEVIDLLRSSIFQVPVPFKQVLYYHTGREEILSRFDRWDLRLQARIPKRLKLSFIGVEVGRGTIFDKSSEDFQDVYESHFGLKFGEADSRLLYSTLLSYMDTRMATDTRRYYALRIFAQNLMFAAIVTAFLSLPLILLNVEDAIFALVGVASIVLLIVFFEVGMIISSVAFPFVDRLIIDYYVDRLQ